MCATLNASTKLPHCGSDGHSSPSGRRVRRMQRGRKRLRNGRIVIGDQGQRAAALPV